MSQIYQTPSGNDSGPRETELASARTKGIASLVLGILALVCCFTGIGALIGLAAAIVGLVLGAKSRKILPPSENGMATAGWVCSIVALCLCALGVLLVFGLFGLFSLIGMGVAV